MHSQSDMDQIPLEQKDYSGHLMVVKVPKMPTIPTVTAVGSGGGLTAAIATGHVQPGVVWPAVVLAIAGMAYDVALRIISRPRRA
ncbi:hypothetical protein ABT173_35815 [Streptomyces sp. NPDC001795]|uniref:hypothetical protein n=1 Tax=Streptomyces sp. NPDC001795 TaxID=3154525 RepID=UPI00332BA9A1